MNDLPAVVAWILAVPIALLAVAGWRLARQVPVPAAPRWRWRVVGWVGGAATLGPAVVVAAVALVGPLLDWRAVAADPGQALARSIGSVVYLGVWYLFVSIAFFALPYAPLLLLWARLGPALQWLERTRGGVALSSAILAVPGALVSVIAYGMLDEPFGYAGAELAQFGALIFGAITVSLWVPRMCCHCLRVGVFGEAPGSGAAARAA